MTIMKFCKYLDHEEGKLAAMETQGESELEIPVNIFAEDGSDYSLEEGTICALDIEGEGYDIDVYTTKDEMSKNTRMAEFSMIPMGTFPLEPDDPDFTPQPTIIFCGKVLDASKNPEPTPDTYNYRVEVKTLDLFLTLYLDSDEDIPVGAYIHGVAWLSAVIQRGDQNDDHS